MYRANVSTRIHAFGDDALSDHDATAIAELIRTRKISPLDAVDAAIERAERVEPALDAIVVRDFENARKAAAATPIGAGFAGVPTFVKDNIDIAGLPTNHGTRAFVARPAKADGVFAKQFLAQGVVNLGKSALPEFGFNASTEFREGVPTRNPWNPTFSAGASSGGAAALVAAGVVPLAHGNDGGGSIRIPAAVCGLVGLKATRGRLREEKLSHAMPIKLVMEGVLTRSVRDTANFFANAEEHYRNSALRPIGRVLAPGSLRLRIGVLPDTVVGNPADSETRATVTAAATLLAESGHHVEELSVPPAGEQFAQDFAVYWGLLSFFVATTGRLSVARDFDSAKLDNLTIGLRDHYRANLLRTPAVLYRLRRSAAEYSRFFDNYDVVLSPVLAHTTPEIGYLSPLQSFDELFEKLRNYVSFTPLNNASGGPAISLPFGESGLGLPIGVHLSANHGDEATLLELAYEIEQATPWRRIDAVPERADFRLSE